MVVEFNASRDKWYVYNAKEIWDAIRQTYSKVNDAARIYEIEMKISTTQQGNRFVTEYSSLLQDLWREMDHYQCIQMCYRQNVAILERFVENDRIYEFLVGLNAEFNAVRVQILGKDLPSLNETISIIRAEEG